MRPPDTPDPEYVTLGRIVGLYGVRGWVKVHSDTDPRENIVSYSRWWLRKSSLWRSIEVLQGKRQGKTIVAQLAGVADRDQAALLMGSDIAVLRGELPGLQPGEYYWTDLIGSTVVTPAGVAFGTVTRLFETGANDVVVVKDERPGSETGAEILIPWVIPSVITNVNLDQKRIVVDWDPDY